MARAFEGKERREGEYIYICNLYNFDKSKKIERFRIDQFICEPGTTATNVGSFLSSE